jgi:hypothetical protein
MFYVDLSALVAILFSEDNHESEASMPGKIKDNQSRTTAFRVPLVVDKAINLAAKKNYQNKSEFIRCTMLRACREAGVTVEDRAA